MREHFGHSHSLGSGVHFVLITVYSKFIGETLAPPHWLFIIEHLHSIPHLGGKANLHRWEKADEERGMRQAERQFGKEG